MNIITILSLFIIGIGVGYLIRKNTSFVRIAIYASTGSIFLLLFLLGTGVGSNVEIVNNLAEYGFFSALIAVLSIGGSILLTLPLYKFIFGKINSPVSNKNEA